MKVQALAMNLNYRSRNIGFKIELEGLKIEAEQVERLSSKLNSCYKQTYLDVLRFPAKILLYGLLEVYGHHGNALSDTDL